MALYPRGHADAGNPARAGRIGPRPLGRARLLDLDDFHGRTVRLRADTLRSIDQTYEATRLARKVIVRCRSDHRLAPPDLPPDQPPI